MSDQIEHRAHGVVVDLGPPGREGLVEESLGVAHGALTLSGQIAQALLRDLDALGLADLGQPIAHFLSGEEAEIVALATGRHRGGDFLGVGGGQHEETIGRGFLQRLE